MTKFNKVVNEIDPKALLIKYDQEKNLFKKCNYLLKNCIEVDFTNENLSTLLEGELKIDDANYQFDGNKFEIKEKIKNNERFKTLDLGKSTIFFEKGVEVEFDSQNKTIEINQKIAGSRSYIFGGSLENFKINFNGKQIKTGKKSSLKEFPPNFPIDNKTLTGCLSLINLTVKNILLMPVTLLRRHHKFYKF